MRAIWCFCFFFFVSLLYNIAPDTHGICSMNIDYKAIPESVSVFHHAHFDIILKYILY